MEVYLDNASTTKLDLKVRDKMQQAMEEAYGNPSSIHDKGEEAKSLIEQSRSGVAAKIGADVEDLYFTSGATESNNLAIRGLLAKSSKKHIVCSAIEHSSVLDLCKQLKKEGYRVSYAAVNSEGFVELDGTIEDDTALVIVMHANNEVGVVQDIEKIGLLCEEKGVLFHCDAAQSLCKVSIDVKKCKVSSMSFSAHKLHGPKGVGALYLSKEIEPLFYGGGQEKNIRPGTENVAGIVGFAEAVKLDHKVEAVKVLRNYLMEKIEEIPKTFVNGSKEEILCNNVNVCFKDIEGETLLQHLNLKKIYVSTGSACSSKKEGASHVLLAMGLSEKDAECSIRFSLSKDSTKEEVDYVLVSLKEIVSTLHALD